MKRQPRGKKQQPASSDSTPAERDPDREHVEDLLDEALAETFPASDAPSITRDPPGRSQ